jgi:DNA-binding beta-propeller fold protein YncE
MVDLLSHLTDAPLANVFVLVSLLFIYFAVAGRIGDKAELGQRRRLAFAIIALCLFPSGVYMHWSHDNSASGLTGTPKAILKLRTPLKSPNGLAFDTAGDLWVSNYGSDQILELDPSTGQELRKMLVGLNGPTRLAFDPLGRLYVTNTRGNTVNVYNKDLSRWKFSRRALTSR